MSQRLIRALLTCVLLFSAPEALADCNPDPPMNGDDVVCDGLDETGYDGSGATGLTITTDGITVLDDSDPGLDSAILISDDNTVTIGVAPAPGDPVVFDATINVTEANGFGIRGNDNNDVTIEVGAQINVLMDGGVAVSGNDNNFFWNRGTIQIDGADGRGLALDMNTTGILPNGAVSTGTIVAAGDRSYAIESGDNSGVFISGTLDVLGVDSRGLSAGNHSNPAFAADITLQATTTVSGDNAFGIKAGNGWVEGGMSGGQFVPTASGIRVRFGTTIAVSGANAYGVFAGDDLNPDATNSFVINQGAVAVAGVDAIGFSLGGNDLLDRFQLDGANTTSAVSFENSNVITGAPDAGPLVEFRGFVPGFENRLFNATGGLISQNTANLGMPNRGIAIRGTDGDEFILNEGTIRGTIELFDGDDRYIHIAGAALAGNVEGGSGVDELVLAGGAGSSSTFDVSLLDAFERIVIRDGAGWALSNVGAFAGMTEISTDGRMEVPVPITLNGDFAVDATGTLAVLLEPGTPPLTVQGASSLDGTLEIASGPNLVPSTTPYRVLAANGGYSGQFQNITSTFASDRFFPVYDAAGLSVIYQTSLFFTTNSANQRAILQHLLDVDAAGGATGDLQALIDSLDTAMGNLSVTYNALSPEVYDAQTQILVEGGRRISNLLLDRPRECQPGIQDPWSRIDKKLPCHARNWSPWIAAIGGFRSRDGHSEHPRYDSQMGGLVAGIDYRPLEGLDLTFAISSQRGDVDAGGSGQSTITLTDLSGHAGYTYGPFRAQAVASWGHGFHQDRRLIRQSETSYAIDSRGNEDHDSDRVTAAVEFGMLFDVDRFQVEPLVGFDWAWVYQRPIHESGAGGFGIRIASRNDSIGSVNAGVRMSTTYRHSRYLIQQLEWMDGVWKPSLEVRWRQVLHGDDRDIDARFQGSPDSVGDFRITGDEDEGGAEIGVGVSFIPKRANRLQFDVRYDAFVAENTLEQDLVGRVMIGF